VFDYFTRLPTLPANDCTLFYLCEYWSSPPGGRWCVCLSVCLLQTLDLLRQLSVVHQFGTCRPVGRKNDLLAKILVVALLQYMIQDFYIVFFNMW